MLVECLNPPTILQGSGSTFGIKACSLQVTPVASFMPSLVLTSGHPSHTSQPNKPAWITTPFHSILPWPPVSPLSLAECCPTCTITLAGQFKLSFIETDLPHAPSISFADNLATLNSMWDDTSSYWKGHSALIIKNFPVVIMYWKQVYTSKIGRNWKSGQWKILKGQYFKWWVSTITFLWLNVMLTSPYLFKRCLSNDTTMEPQRNFGACLWLMETAGTTRQF